MAGKREKKWMESVAGIGCLICRENGFSDSPAEVHHVFQKRSAYLTVPLCPSHHRGPRGFHGLGQRAFEAMYSMTEQDLLAMTIEALA